MSDLIKQGRFVANFMHNDEMSSVIHAQTVANLCDRIEQLEHEISEAKRPSDIQRVNAMEEANWKPAGQYWRERAEKAEAERDEALARHWPSEPDTEIGGYSAFTAPDGSVWVHSSAVKDAHDLIQHSQAERDAIAAAAFEAAAMHMRKGCCGKEISGQIRALTNADAKAALDLMLAAVAPLVTVKLIFDERNLGLSAVNTRDSDQPEQVH